MFGILVAAGWIVGGLFNPDLDPGMRLLAVPAGLLLGGLALVGMYVTYRWDDSAEAAAQGSWERANARFRNAFYCARCDRAFDSASEGAMPPNVFRAQVFEETQQLAHALRLRSPWAHMADTVRLLPGDVRSLFGTAKDS